jgi:hypothetical protein
MAKTREYQISWTLSASTDVVGYKIYYVPEEEELNYGSPSVTVENVNTVIIPTDVPEFPKIDGNYTIGLSALDDSGNESDIVSKTVPFDLVAPSAPSELVVTPV